MARKICTAGVVGSYSFVVLAHKDGAESSIRNDCDEITARHDDFDFATQWTDGMLRDLIGKQYEDN